MAGIKILAGDDDIGEIAFLPVKGFDVTRDPVQFGQAYRGVELIFPCRRQLLLWNRFRTVYDQGAQCKSNAFCFLFRYLLALVDNGEIDLALFGNGFNPTQQFSLVGQGAVECCIGLRLYRACWRGYQKKAQAK